MFFLQAFDILKEAASLSDAVLHDVQSVSSLSEVCCLFLLSSKLRLSISFWECNFAKTIQSESTIRLEIRLEGINWRRSCRMLSPLNQARYNLLPRTYSL